MRNQRPGGNFNTTLDLHVFPYTDPYQSMSQLVGAGAGGGLSCTTNTFNFTAPGMYLLSVSPGNGFFDGDDGIRPLTYSDSEFLHFDYDGMVSGEGLVLTSIWRGQPDGTFAVTNVPEPSAGIIGAFVAGLLTCFRRRRVAGVSVAMLMSVAGASTAAAEQGILRWQGREGMGYRLQRSGHLGTPWISLPVEYYGTGSEMWHRCFELELPAPTTGSIPLQQVVPVRSLTASVRRDGSAILRWTQDGIGVAAYIAPPPAGTSQAAASAPPFFDFRTVPGTAWHAVNNPLRSGATMLPAVAPVGTTPGFAYRLLVMVLTDQRQTLPAPNVPPLTESQITGRDERLGRVAGIRAAISATPPAPEALPPLRSPFDAYGNPDRDFYRMTPFLLDSDGDGYSDSGEIQSGSDPHDDTSLPQDTDGDGFSDAEETDTDGDGLSDSPLLYFATNAASHPAGGWIPPYLGVNDLVITEFMVANEDALPQVVNGVTRTDDWVEIYNPTQNTIPLNEDLNGDLLLTPGEDTNGNGQLDAGEDTNSDGLLTPPEDTNGNGVLDIYYLTDRDRNQDARKWRLPGSIGPRQFIVVMADGNPAGADGNGFLHASFGYGEIGNDNVVRLTRHDATETVGWRTVSEYWIGTRRPEGQNADTPVPPANVITPRDMFSREDESYGTFAGADGTLQRGLLRRPTPGRHNSEGYLPTLPAPDFIDPVTFSPVAAGLRNAPPAGGMKVQISHPWNRDTDPENDVVVLWTGNSAEPTEFSDIASGQAAAVAEDFSSGIGAGWAHTDNVNLPDYTAPAPHGSFSAANGEGVLQVTGNAYTALVALRIVNLNPGDWRLQFRARSGGAARPLTFGVSVPVPDDDPVNHSQTVTLGTTMQSYSVESTQQATAYEAQGIVFLDFRTATDSVILDDLVFYRKTSGGVVTLDGTEVLRAFAVRDGWERSRVATRSYLFKASILGTAAAGVEPADHQGARDEEDEFLGLLRGYPELTEISTGDNEFGDDFWLLYSMHPGVISARKAPAQGLGLSLSEELDAVPVVSIVTDVTSFFDRDAAGIYANSSKTDGQSGFPDPRGTEWQRAASFEFIEPGMAAYTQTNTGLLITGGSSIQQDVTRKHNLRVRFTGAYGEAELNYPVFGTNGVVNFKSLHLKNPTHDSWSNTWSTNAGQLLHNGVTSGYKPADVATYSNDGWARSAHEAMGHVIPRQRWVHLFLNGIYWGPHQISERVDDDFMDSHFGPGSYDVLKQGPEALDGGTVEWQNMITLCMSVDAAVTDVEDAADDKAAADAAYAADPSPANLAARDAAAAALASAEAALENAYNAVDAVVDLENYIDYLIVNTYMANQDWCGNNWRAARNRAGGEWKFFIWDAEWSFRPGEQRNGLNGLYSPDPYAFFGCGEQMDIANYLQRSQTFRDLYSERIRRHFFLDAEEPGSGTFAITGGVDGAVSLFEDEMVKFEPVLYCESARWGDMSKSVPFTKTDSSYLSGKPYGDWERNTAYTTTVWLPERRTHFLTRMEQVFLYQP